MRRPASAAIEDELRAQGYCAVAGVDEVGRGALCGPVMAAAVILDPGRPIEGVCDSKMLLPQAREEVYERIVGAALGWCAAAVEADEIDRVNIHRAALTAMRRAVLGLARPPDYVIVDAFVIPDLPCPQRPIRHGDARCAAIAAASIVAKVTRDRIMSDLHRTYPGYGLDRHKGYATSEHLAALSRLGLSPIHRRSFRPWTLPFDDECIV